MEWQTQRQRYEERESKLSKRMIIKRYLKKTEKGKERGKKWKSRGVNRKNEKK